ncbi:uncharacterized protein HGUI_01141 [Hanseniaspora guilliermondii]|uniref:GATA-type domain-containing protein n=1 Tax=Hanseniaspora guilliermondii TaxID=56406 RepID=A0A1L0CJG8_9ASCO|nr:uncharacterized protein HGUI_01141 [Hanseniaspora guilliermondii]
MDSVNNISTVEHSNEKSPVNVPKNDIADLRFTMEQQFIKQLQLKSSKNEKQADGKKQPIQTLQIRQLHEQRKPISSEGDVTCSNCSTKKTPLWRRDENGYILCNACGLFFKLHGKPRPISLKTDIIRSRNRKTKAEKAKLKDNEEKPATKKRKSNKKSQSPIPQVTNSLLNNSKSNGLISAAAYLGSNSNSAGNGLIKIVPKSENDYLLQNQHINGSYQISANQGIVNKVKTGIAMYADRSSDQTSNVLLKPVLNNVNEDKNSINQKIISINNRPMRVTPRIGPIWSNNQQVPSPNAFKSPTMLAIDKLASVSRQVASPLLISNQENKYHLPPITNKDQKNANLEIGSPEPINKLPNLKNVLINEKDKTPIASISSILSSQHNVKDDKDDQIRTLTTENKELELKLDICKNKIMELERKIYDLENNI